MTLKAKAGSLKEVFGIALPMMISNACDTVMTVTDRYFLSQLGPEHMAAAMGGGVFSFTMMSFFIGILGYSTAMVAQNYGADKKEMCFRVTFQAILIALLSFPVIISFIPLFVRSFDWIGLDPLQIEQQVPYFSILTYGCVLPLLRMALSNFFSGLGLTNRVMFSSFVTLIVNVVANYILIFGRLGIEPMGIRGAAIGSLIASASGVLTLILFIFCSDYAKEFKILSSCRFDKKLFKTLIKFGYPAGIEFFLNLMAFSLIVSLFQKHSLVSATAITVVLNWDMVAFVPLIGLEIATTSLVGRYVGAKNYDIAHKSVVSSFKLGMIYCLIVSCAFAFFPYFLIELYRPDGYSETFNEALPLSVTMLRITSLYVLVEALMIVYSGALRGAGDTFWAMIISVSIHWSLVAVLYLSLFILNYSVVTSWLNLSFVFLVLSTAFYLRYRSGNWKKIQVI